jgi:phosphatidylserine/phosphatidylglycerophosphate/cardiolipin synthase-like enzyme
MRPSFPRERRGYDAAGICSSSAETDNVGGVDFVRPSRSVAMRFVSGRGHYETVIHTVQGARTSVWIATANLKELMVEDLRWSLRRRRRGGTSYRSVIEIFAELVAAGVEIRLLHASPPSRPFREELARHEQLRGCGASRRGSGRSALRSELVTLNPRRPPTSGVFPAPSPAASTGESGRFEMRLCPRVHLKAVVVDGEFLYLGSANWTGAGLGVKGTGRRNFELGIVTDDAPLLDDVQEIFDRIWRGKECAACKLRGVCPRPLDTPSKAIAVPSKKATSTAPLPRRTTTG